MAFGGFDQKDAAPMAEINMIPLVDIMLVLLVIFIITAPVLTHSIKVDLPRFSNVKHEDKPEHIQLSIDERGRLFWNDEALGEQDLPRRLQEAARAKPDVELHLRADKQTPYEALARVMGMAHRNQVHRIAFVLQPDS